MRRYKVLVSIAILLIILLHALPVLHRGLRKRVWPFLDWAMYKDAVAAGPVRADIRQLVGVTRAGGRIDVDDDTVGVSSFVMDRLYIKPMLQGDSSAARQLAGLLNRERRDSIIEIRLETETYTATDSGIVKSESPDIAYRVGPSDSR
jgi:hypothetical protein